MSLPAAANANGGSASSFTVIRPTAMVTTLDLDLTVPSIAEAARRLREEVARRAGYVANASTSGDGKDMRASLELRIPSDQLQSFRAVFADLGSTTSETERVEDVGEERADRKARLDNARAEEARLLDLLAHRAGTLAEVLEAERELSRVRETIERFDAQAAALEGKIAYATLHVTLSPRFASFEERPLVGLGEAFAKGLHYATSVVVLLAIGTAQAGPPLLVLSAMLLALLLSVRSVLRFLARRHMARLQG